MKYYKELIDQLNSYYSHEDPKHFLENEVIPYQQSAAKHYSSATTKSALDDYRVAILDIEIYVQELVYLSVTDTGTTVNALNDVVGFTMNALVDAVFSSRVINKNTKDNVLYVTIQYVLFTLGKDSKAKIKNLIS